MAPLSAARMSQARGHRLGQHHAELLLPERPRHVEGVQLRARAAAGSRAPCTTRGANTSRHLVVRDGADLDPVAEPQLGGVRAQAVLLGAAADDPHPRRGCPRRASSATARSTSWWPFSHTSRPGREDHVLVRRVEARRAEAVEVDARAGRPRSAPSATPSSSSASRARSVAGRNRSVAARTSLAVAARVAVAVACAGTGASPTRSAPAGSRGGPCGGRRRRRTRTTAPPRARCRRARRPRRRRPGSARRSRPRRRRRAARRGSRSRSAVTGSARERPASPTSNSFERVSR